MCLFVGLCETLDMCHFGCIFSGVLMQFCYIFSTALPNAKRCQKECSLKIWSGRFYAVRDHPHHLVSTGSLHFCL